MSNNTPTVFSIVGITAATAAVTYGIGRYLFSFWEVLVDIKIDQLEQHQEITDKLSEIYNKLSDIEDKVADNSVDKSTCEEVPKKAMSPRHIVKPEGIAGLALEPEIYAASAVVSEQIPMTNTAPTSTTQIISMIPTIDIPVTNMQSVVENADAQTDKPRDNLEEHPMLMLAKHADNSRF